MKYKERPVCLRRKGNAKYTDETLVDIDRERFDFFCEAFGGYKAVSEKIGKHSEYIDRVFRERKADVLPFPTYILICDTFGLEDKFLMGFGKTREFERWVKQNKPETKKDKHAVCDEYCIGCMHSFKASSLTMEVELGCSFYCSTGEMRGCPAGTGCNRKEEGKNTPKPFSIFY